MPGQSVDIWISQFSFVAKNSNQIFKTGHLHFLRQKRIYWSKYPLTLDILSCPMGILSRELCRFDSITLHCSESNGISTSLKIHPCFRPRGTAVGHLWVQRETEGCTGSHRCSIQRPGLPRHTARHKLWHANWYWELWWADITQN